MPKTATSFGIVIIRAACPGLTRGWTPSQGRVVNATIAFGSGRRPLIAGYRSGSFESALRSEASRACCTPEAMLLRWHTPLRLPDMRTKVVTMLRPARQRLLSAFYAGLHVGGSRLSGGRLDALYTNVTCPAAFARFDGVSNCQTKMLIGCRCGGMCGGIGRARPWSRIHNNALSQATRVLLHRVFFVGLTDHFDISVRLLHRALGLRPHDQPKMTNLRPGVAQLSASRTGSNSSYNERELDVDFAKKWTPDRPWSRCRGTGVAPFIEWEVPSAQLEELDQAVYMVAAKRFWQMLDVN
jgi:hypothetical protein